MIESNVANKAPSSKSITSTLMVVISLGFKKFQERIESSVAAIFLSSSLKHDCYLRFHNSASVEISRFLYTLNPAN